MKSGCTAGSHCMGQPLHGAFGSARAQNESAGTRPVRSRRDTPVRAIAFELLSFMALERLMLHQPLNRSGLCNKGTASAGPEERYRTGLASEAPATLRVACGLFFYLSRGATTPFTQIPSRTISNAIVLTPSSPFTHLKPVCDTIRAFGQRAWSLDAAPMRR